MTAPSYRDEADRARIMANHARQKTRERQMLEKLGDIEEWRIEAALISYRIASQALAKAREQVFLAASPDEAKRAREACKTFEAEVGKWRKALGIDVEVDMRRGGKA